GKAHVQDHGHHPGSAKLSGLAPYLGNFDRLAGEFQGRQLGWKDGVANVCEDREIKGLRFDFDSRRSCSPHRCYGLASKLRCRPEMLEQIIDEARAEMVLAKGAFFGVARDSWVPLREMVFEIGKKTVGTEMPWRREIRSRSAWAKIHPTGARILGIRRDDQLEHDVSGPWRDMSARIRRSIPDFLLFCFSPGWNQLALRIWQDSSGGTPGKEIPRETVAEVFFGDRSCSQFGGS